MKRESPDTRCHETAHSTKPHPEGARSLPPTDACGCACASGHDHAHDHSHGETSYWKLGIALVIALGVEILHVFAPENRLLDILTLVLALVAIALSGISVYIDGLRALLRGRLNINALMAVAVTGACFLAQWAEAA
ncbi:MAG: hypothetical protein LBM56_01120, partial [Burkholderiaceae bacterium]|nr:hypothetical protein [Burkholderiaceae bacterium]